MSDEIHVSAKWYSHQARGKFHIHVFTNCGSVQQPQHHKLSTVICSNSLKPQQFLEPQEFHFHHLHPKTHLSLVNRSSFNFDHNENLCKFTDKRREINIVNLLHFAGHGMSKSRSKYTRIAFKIRHFKSNITSLLQRCNRSNALLYVLLVRLWIWTFSWDYRSVYKVCNGTIHNVLYYQNQQDGKSVTKTQPYLFKTYMFDYKQEPLYKIQYPCHTFQSTLPISTHYQHG